MAITKFRLAPGFDLACTDDGRTIACIGRRLNLFDAASGKNVSTSHPFPHPSSAAFSPKGSILAVKSTSGRIAVVYSATGEVLFDHKNQSEGEGCEVLFSPDGTEVIDGSWKGVVTIRKALEQTVVAPEEFTGEMITRVSHDSSRRFWLVEHCPKVRPGENWNDYGYLVLKQWPFSKHKTRTFNFDFYIRSTTLSPDGNHFCAVCNPRGAGRYIQVFSVSNGQPLAKSGEIDIGGSMRDLTWSTDCQYLGSIQSKRFVFYRALDLTIVAEIPGNYLSSICFLPNSNRVVLGSWNTSILADFDDVLAGKVKMPKPR